MANWDILDDDNTNGNGDVEYVGVVEEDEPARVVREPMRRRRMVRRVAPQAPVQPQYPVRPMRQQQSVIGAANRDEEDLVSYVNMPYGKQLGLTAEAVKRMQEAPMGRVNGQAAQRIEPGTYVMYGPNRADAMGMGTNGTEPGTQQTQQTQQTGPTWLRGMFSAIGELGAGIAGAVVAGRRSQREQATERMRIQVEADAAAEARDIAFRETQLEHAERMARIEAGAEELEALQRQAEEAAALRRELGPAAPAGAGVAAGPSPVIWILVAVLGLGAVGGTVWYFGFRKKDRREYEE
jgi:hypothetical protein